MQKVTVRFISEGMTVVNLLKQLSIKDGGIEKGVREYLRKKGNNIHYLDFLLLKKFHPKLFEYYTFTFYKYSDECESYYSNIHLIDSLSQYEQIWSFHSYLKPSTKHFFVGHSESVKILIELTKKGFENNSTKILQSLIQYARENKPELYFFHFLSTLFLISIADEYETIDKQKRLVKLKIFPALCFRPGPAKAQKIEITSLDPVSIGKITEIICTNKISGLYIITKHKNKHKRTIEMVKTILVNNFIEVSDYRIVGPYQGIDFDLNNKNLFLVFEDSKNFFDRMSYKNNVGIFMRSRSIYRM